MYFFGSYNCKADAKGRVMLPISFRNQLAPVLQDIFVVKKSYLDNCLEFYPIQEWKNVLKGLDEKSQFKPEDVDFVRKFTANLRQVSIDATGRLLIPKDVIVDAGINKNVVLVSMGKYIEIWDKDIYEQTINATKEEKKDLQDRVMNQVKPKNELP